MDLSTNGLIGKGRCSSSLSSPLPPIALPPPLLSLPFPSLYSVSSLLPSPQPYQGTFTQVHKHTGRKQPSARHGWDGSAGVLTWGFQSLERWENQPPSAKPPILSFCFSTSSWLLRSVFPPQSHTTLGRRSWDETVIKYSQPISLEFSTSVACFQARTLCQALV